jgi:hypothetical protein
MYLPAMKGWSQNSRGFLPDWQLVKRPGHPMRLLDHNQNRPAEAVEFA